MPEIPESNAVGCLCKFPLWFTAVFRVDWQFMTMWISAEKCALCAAALWQRKQLWYSLTANTEGTRNEGASVRETWKMPARERAHSVLGLFPRSAYKHIKSNMLYYICYICTFYCMFQEVSLAIVLLHTLAACISNHHTSCCCFLAQLQHQFIMLFPTHSYML